MVFSVGVTTGSRLMTTCLGWLGTGVGGSAIVGKLQCRGVQLIWIIGQGPAALTVSAGDIVWPFFSLTYYFSLPGGGPIWTELLSQSTKRQGHRPTNHLSEKELSIWLTLHVSFRELLSI